MLILEEENI
ncbi:hypothetical protein SAMN04515618_11467 [Collimonas sp. OK307]|nr:hypothetical protein SAMN04515618_11467 [Collimonas sp. OK307]